MTDFTIVRRSLLGRLFGTITTIITVAVAVGLMLVLLSMRDAGKQAFSRGGGNMHLVVSAERDPMTAVLNNIFYARLPQNFMYWKDYQQLASSLPWEWAIPIQQGDSYHGFPVLATTPDFFSKFHPAPDSGWRFDSGHAFEKDLEVVVGCDVASAGGLKLGDSIILTHGMPKRGEHAHEHDDFKFTVVGVLGRNGTSHDRALFVPLQSAWLLHAQDRLERAAGPDHDHEHERIATPEDLTDDDRKITGVYLRVPTREGHDASASLPAFFDHLRKSSAFTVAQPKQEIDRLFAIVGNIDQLLVAMAVVVMVSSGIAIMLALYNSMEQRRRQIAVLRVLGASRGRIFGLVLTESALLGLLGVGVGILGAMGGARILASVLRARLGLVVEPSLALDALVLVGIGTMLLAIVAGIVPAVMAYRTSVARNLRPIG
jgi:putative ABC transport system permease protein